MKTGGTGRLKFLEKCCPERATPRIYMAYPVPPERTKQNHGKEVLPMSFEIVIVDEETELLHHPSL